MKTQIAAIIGGLLTVILLVLVLQDQAIKPLVKKVSAGTERITYDREDDISGPQIKLMYVVPFGAADRQFDVDGTIPLTFNSIQYWLAQQSGKRLNVDTHNGELDIGFVELDKTDQEMADLGPYIREEIESQMKMKGFNNPEKIYAVYYDGASYHSCGAGAWPPEIPGNVAALYLHGQPPNAPACDTNQLDSTGFSPGYYEFAFLHEILHTLGGVATCAPNETLRGHVSDDPRDIMYAGELNWNPSILDSGQNDYWGTGDTNCQDISQSPYFSN